MPWKSRGQADCSRQDEPGQLFFEPGRAYCLQVGALWSGPGQWFRPGWLVVENGRIASVGPGKAPANPAWQSHDLSCRQMLPGLVDAHVHLNLKPGQDPGEAARRAAAMGLAAVRDGGDKACLTLTARKSFSDLMIVVATGTALFAPGRYGSFLGRPVDSRREMAGTVRELAAAGVDQIKVLASGPVDLDVFGRVGPPQFRPDDLLWLTELARDEGLGVMAHANGPEAVEMCIRAGVLSVEHGYFMGPKALDLLAESGVAWVPTIEPLVAQRDRNTDSSGRGRVIRRTIAHQSNQVVRAGRLGVGLVLGTDAGAPGVEAGPGLFRELACWLSAGLTGEEALTAATARAADLLGLSRELGSLSEGHLAFMAGYPLHVSLERALTGPPEFVGRPVARAGYED